MKKCLAIILLLLIIINSIVYPAKEAKAFVPVIAIGLAEVTPAIVAALATLIAAGLVVHSDDVALEAAKAYKAAGKAVGIISNGVITVGSAAVSEAHTWLSSWASTVAANSTDIYTQPLGNISQYLIPWIGQLGQR